MHKSSIILMDWNVRESFHTVEFINRQSIPRDDYEVIWVEYYNRRPEEIDWYVNQGKIDKWVVLNLNGLYHHHIQINEGFLASDGEIIIIPDSDSIIPEYFLESVLSTFKTKEKIFGYVDEIRIGDKELYPYPFGQLYSWDIISDALRFGKYLNLSGRSKNYGACFCIKRESVIEAGGWDEDEIFRGYMAGAFEMGLRLANKGYKEVWLDPMYLLHLYHPYPTEENKLGEYTDEQKQHRLLFKIKETGRTEVLTKNRKFG